MSDVEDHNDDDQVTFFVSASQIKNKTILSPSVQEFCRDLDAYWLTQMDNNTVHIDGANTQYPADGDHDREKRNPCSNRICESQYCTPTYGVWKYECWKEYNTCTNCGSWWFFNR
ncbi:uncharacterized protein LOC106154162 [Lingula anatina]|uniref:Uncharacterized protein LOC106154162 n=1 Tax=Lingula anatina TaxID=7574 RepID=A0A1S3HFR5_LINAN|nr:uncharacterized protein LOC106154162 [Lingula anatina]|eukprot:XP_013383879.1 uncharacterized protein LOC106154162 [Lingula anatina]